jgi:hypothetical protein
MPRPPVRRVVSAVAALAVLATGALAVGAAPADAAMVDSAGCVDGGGVRWEVEVTWGAVYPAADGVRRVSLDRAAWTTAAGSTPTDSRVRTYDGAGTRLQDLSWSGAFDYRSGTAWKARNPVNPPSAPGGARVVVTLGVDGDGFGSCSVTLTQPASTSVTAAERYEADIATATNAERTSRGLVALRPQACVDSYAAAQARRMAEEQRMYHQELGPLLEACRLRAVGENVAVGYPTGAAVTAAWMASPGHRANLLKPTSTLLGVGAAQGPDGRWYAAQVFGTPA